MDWFVVATKPNGERTAEVNLRQQGFDVFVPLMQKTRRHARRVETVLRPLFPGYLFIQFDAATMPWRSVNGTFGVRHILSNNGRPQPIVTEFVETLKAAMGSNGAVEEYTPSLTQGDTVEIMNGAMQGHLATILSTDDHGRVRILLTMMGGDIVSTISPEDLEKAS